MGRGSALLRACVVFRITPRYLGILPLRNPPAAGPMRNHVRIAGAAPSGRIRIWRKCAPAAANSRGEIRCSEAFVRSACSLFWYYTEAPVVGAPIRTLTKPEHSPLCVSEMDHALGRQRNIVSIIHWAVKMRDPAVAARSHVSDWPRQVPSPITQVRAPRTFCSPHFAVDDTPDAGPVDVVNTVQITELWAFDRAQQKMLVAFAHVHELHTL